MKKLACQYKIVRFVPFSETEEFANIGVVLFCPSLQSLKFRFANVRFGRISQFFHDMDPAVYKNIIYTLRHEFDRINKQLEKENREVAQNIFAELTRPKGGIVKFSDSRVVFTDNIDNEIGRLFDHYVGRSFNTTVYREQVLEKELRASLKRLSLDQFYKRTELSAGLYEIQMPFVRTINGKHKGVIKPLAFDQKTPGSVVEHADKWLSRAKHLIDHSVEAENMLFALEIKHTSNSDLRDYLFKFKSKLESIGVHAVDSIQNKEVIEFAQHH